MKRRRFLEALTAALLAVTMIGGDFALAAPPSGKGPNKDDSGGGGGGVDDGGGSGSLPAGLTTRYAVQTIPLPAARVLTSGKVSDINEYQVVVGYYEDELGRYVGYRYDGQSGRFETSDQMLDLLDTNIIEVAFIGVNNYDAIAAQAGNLDGSVQGILIYPDGFGGWAWELLEAPYDRCDYYYARKINDSGDIVGVYRDEAGVVGPYSHNPGIYTTPDLPLYLAPTSWGTTFRPNGVSNTRLAIGGSPADATFDFVAASEGSPAVTDLLQDPELYFSATISNDGQIPANRYVEKGKNKGHYVEIYQDGQRLVFGPTIGIGEATRVNSRSGSNPVGDILLKNSVRRLSLYHADWGLLDLDEMAVFADSETPNIWFNNNLLFWEMSDRDATGFPAVAARAGDFHYLLIPINQ